MKALKQNRDIVFRSTVTALQTAWSEYKKLMTEYYRYIWVADDGRFAFLSGAEERKKRLNGLYKDVVRLADEIERMRGEQE